MTYQVPGTPPGFVWISARRAQRVRTACTLVGAGLVAASVLLGVLIAVLGGRLPTSYNPINVVMFGMGCVSAFILLFSGVSLAGSRPYVAGEHLNVTGARTARRILGLLWGGATVGSAMACLLLVLMVADPPSTTNRPELHFTVAVWSYLVLLALPGLLAGVAFFVGRRLLRPAAVDFNRA